MLPIKAGVGSNSNQIEKNWSSHPLQYIPQEKFSTPAGFALYVLHQNVWFNSLMYSDLLKKIRYISLVKSFISCCHSSSE